MAPPSAAASFAEDTQRLRQREIIFFGDFDGALASADYHDREPDLLAERGVVGGHTIGFARFTVSALDDSAWECLRRLGSPDTEPIYRHDDLAARVDALESVEDWKRRDGAVSIAGLFDHAGNRLARHQRPSSVVDDDDLAFGWEILESVRDGLAPVAATNGE